MPRTARHLRSNSSPQPPRPPRRAGRSVASTVLIIIGAALILASVGLFVRAQLGYRQAQDSYEKLEQYAVPAATADDGEENVDNVPTVDFDALERINPDVVGWIYVPGTVINYPVVQTGDNETYLHKLFDQSGNGSGSIFMDMDDTAPGMVDQQTTLYGHHMNDGSMFKFIDNTLNQADFDTMGNVYYITRDATYAFRPLFTMQVPDTYGDARLPSFGDAAEFQKYLADSLAQAHAQAADADKRVSQTTQVLTLVTCAGEIIPRTTRAAMVCQLVSSTPMGASSAAAASSAATASSAPGGA